MTSVAVITIVVGAMVVWWWYVMVVCEFGKAATIETESGV